MMQETLLCPPDSLRVGRRKMSVRWDVTTGVLLSEMLDDPLLSEAHKLKLLLKLLYRRPVPKSSIEAAAKAAVWFFQGGGTFPKEKTQSAPCVFSLWQDLQFVLPSFLQVYGLHPLESGLHWWTFLSLLEGLPEDCALGRVLAVRRAEVHPQMPAAVRQLLLEAKACVALDAAPKSDAHAQQILAQLKKL